MNRKPFVWTSFTALCAVLAGLLAWALLDPDAILPFFLTTPALVLVLAHFIYFYPDWMDVRRRFLHRHPGLSPLVGGPEPRLRQTTFLAALGFAAMVIVLIVTGAGE